MTLMIGSCFINSIGFAQVITEKKVLDNGLTVLVSQLPSSQVVSVYGLVKTGSASEGEFLGSGISHYLEHMLFKMTDHRAVGEIAAKIQSVGGSINAQTGKDYTMYTITVPVDAIDTAVDILADMLINTKFDPTEAEKERKVILNEMRLHNDNPDTHLADMTDAQVYVKHPYRHPIIGYAELLGKITTDDLTKYYKTHYAPNNTIVSIAGPVSMNDVLSRINKYFNHYERQMDVPRNLPDEPLQFHSKYYEEEYPTDLTRLTISYKSVSLLNKDLFALDVLAGILGQGESSRLYQEIFQTKKLVYAVSAYNYTPIDLGKFSIVATLDRPNQKQVIDAVRGEIERIKKSGVTPQELEKTKKQVESDYIFSNQTTSSVAYSRALDEAFTGDYNFSLNYVDEIKKVTADEVKKAAQLYLNQNNETITVLVPKGQEQSAESKDTSFYSQEIKKTKLRNGLTVLIKPDNHFPLVSVQLAVNGGLRQEPAEINGVSRMTSQLWLKGTKSKTSLQISELIESLGMNLSSYSGKNSFGLSLETLKEDFVQGLNLLEDVVKNPVFPQEEITQMKNLMLADIKERKDNVGQFTGLTMKQLLYLKHPYRFDEGGSEESVAKISRSDIVDFYQKNVLPSNMVLSVIGDVDADQVLKMIRQKFESLPNKAAEIKATDEPPIDAPRIKSITMNKEQAMVMLGFHAPTIFSADRYGMEVLTSILGSSFSGRLFSKIREDLGKAYTLGGNYVPGIDTGFVYFYVLTSEENIDKVVDLLKNEISDIRQNLVGDQELKDIQTYLKGNQKDDLQTNSALNFAASLDELYGLGFNHYQQYDQNIDAVTKDDIKRLAEKYLDLNKSVLVTTHSSIEKK